MAVRQWDGSSCDQILIGTTTILKLVTRTRRDLEGETCERVIGDKLAPGRRVGAGRVTSSGVGKQVSYVGCERGIRRQWGRHFKGKELHTGSQVWGF